MDKKVKVYSTPTCPYCIRTKQFLREKNIDFEDFDVSVDQSKAQEMINLSGQMAVPVIVANDSVVVGFDRDKLEQLLS